MNRSLLVITLLVAAIVGNAQKIPPDVDAVIKGACKEAALQNKKAFIIFHASWCVWCHKLDSSINDAVCKDFFMDNFIVRHITVFETGEKTV